MSIQFKLVSLGVSHCDNGADFVIPVDAQTTTIGLRDALCRYNWPDFLPADAVRNAIEALVSHVEQGQGTSGSQGLFSELFSGASTFAPPKAYLGIKIPEPAGYRVEHFPDGSTEHEGAHWGYAEAGFWSNGRTSTTARTWIWSDSRFDTETEARIAAWRHKLGSPQRHAEFTAGRIEGPSDDQLFRAGIDHTPSGAVGDAEVWWDRIEVHGNSHDDAKQLRDRVLAGLAGSATIHPSPRENLAPFAFQNIDWQFAADKYAEAAELFSIAAEMFGDGQGKELGENAEYERGMAELICLKVDLPLDLVGSVIAEIHAIATGRKVQQLA